MSTAHRLSLQTMRLSWLVLLASCGHVLPQDTPPVDADPCTGVCECRLDTDCAGDHTACDDEVTSRTCGCAAGYTTGVSGTCEWSGVVADPGFQAATTWSTGSDGATIDPNLNDPGMVEAGAGEFHMNGMCNLARITQMITMPKFSRAEPLVVQLSYRYRNTAQLTGAPSFGIGTAWHDDLPAASATFITARQCLGAASYAPESITKPGAALPLVVMPTTADFQCNDAGEFLDVDHVEILPANPGECATPGTAINGDAESTGGWQFSSFGVNGTMASAMIENGVGEGNSHGARVFFTNRCSSGSVADVASVPGPDEVASPALSFFNRSTNATDTDRVMNVSFGGISIPPPGSATGVTTKYCMPASMRGGSFTFASSFAVDGLCADVINAEAVYDSLKFVNDPTCGSDPAITDPGFESTGNALFGAFSTVGASIARAANDPANAHSGSGVLQLSVNLTCSGASFVANVVTPSSQGAAGPAVTFFYKAPTPVDYKLVATGFNFMQPALTYDNTYHQATLCLNPKLAGRNQQVSFGMSSVAGTCNTQITAEQAFIDDLAVTTDPSCAPM